MLTCYTDLNLRTVLCIMMATDSEGPGRHAVGSSIPANVSEDRIQVHPYTLQDSGCKTILTTKDNSTTINQFDGMIRMLL